MTASLPLQHKGVESHAASNRQVRAGRAISALCVLFLLLDSAIKLLKLPAAVEGTVRLGYPEGVVFELGMILLACTILYLIPRTSMLGAILLTGYLGGATATHVRVGQAFLLPIIFGVLVWAGLYLRAERLRTVLFTER